MKTRANLTVDHDLWESAKVFFAENPQMGSISAFIEMTLREFMEVMPEMVAKARAGDGSAALQVLQRSANSRSAEISLGLNELEEMVSRQPALFTPVPRKAKSTQEKGTKPRKKSN